MVFATVVCVWFAWRKLFGKRMRYPPGPRGWPLLGALPYLGTRPHDSLRELSKKYGPIMFMYWGLRPALIVSTPETAKAILKTHDHTFAGRPALENVSYMFWDLQDFAFTGYTHRWRELRKMCTMHLFTHARVVQYQVLNRMHFYILHCGSWTNYAANTETLCTETNAFDTMLATLGISPRFGVMMEHISVANLPSPYNRLQVE